jgi:hypothetical protein
MGRPYAYLPQAIPRGIPLLVGFTDSWALEKGLNSCSWSSVHSACHGGRCGRDRRPAPCSSAPTDPRVLPLPQRPPSSTATRFAPSAIRVLHCSPIPIAPCLDSHVRHPRLSFSLSWPGWVATVWLWLQGGGTICLD